MDAVVDERLSIKEGSPSRYRIGYLSMNDTAHQDSKNISFISPV